MKVIQMIRNWVGQMLLKFSPRPRIGKRKFPFPALSSSKQPVVALWIYFTFGERAKIKAADRRFSIAILDSMDGNTFLFGSAVFCGIWGNALSLSLSLCPSIYSLLAIAVSLLGNGILCIDLMSCKKSSSDLDKSFSCTYAYVCECVPDSVAILQAHKLYR